MRNYDFDFDFGGTVVGVKEWSRFSPYRWRYGCAYGGIGGRFPPTIEIDLEEEDEVATAVLCGNKIIQPVN